MNQDSHEPQSNIERLADELSETNAYLRQVFSLRSVIARGVISGIALVVGSTVFAGILFSAIQLIFGDVPFIPGGY